MKGMVRIKLIHSIFILISRRKHGLLKAQGSQNAENQEK